MIICTQLYRIDKNWLLFSVKMLKQAGVSCIIVKNKLLVNLSHAGWNVIEKLA